MILLVYVRLPFADRKGGRRPLRGLFCHRGGSTKALTYHHFLIFLVGAIHESPAVENKSKTKPLYVILSAVELLLSGKRGRSAKRNAVCGIS